MLWTCIFKWIQREFKEQSLVTLWVNWCKNENFWKIFICTYLDPDLKLIVFDFFHSCHLPEKLGTKLLGPCHLANQDLVLSKSETTITKLIGNPTVNYPTWLISNSKGKPLLAQLQFTQISGETLKVEKIFKGSLIENKKFVDITQQCFALLPQINFPYNNLNFHWRLSS